MKHELVWTHPLYEAPDQECACGTDPCPALHFKWMWQEMTYSVSEMLRGLFPMLRHRWTTRVEVE